MNILHYCMRRFATALLLLIVGAVTSARAQNSSALSEVNAVNPDSVSPASVSPASSSPALASPASSSDQQTSPQEPAADVPPPGPKQLTDYVEAGGDYLTLTNGFGYWAGGYARGVVTEGHNIWNAEINGQHELEWTMGGITTKSKLNVTATELELTDDANRTIKYKRR